MLSRAAQSELRAAALARGVEPLLDWVRTMLAQPEPHERQRMRFVGDDDDPLSKRETYND